MAFIPAPVPPKEPARDTEAYLSSSRWESVSHFKTEFNKPGHSISDYFAKSFGWIYHYVKSRFGPKAPYQAYTGTNTGVYDLPTDGPASLAITSDWATDTDESFAIAAAIRQHQPDYTVHVGDTYFVGAPPEIQSNFLVPGSPWVRGERGSFAVLGNHEMYARGTAFFDELLPSLGLKDSLGRYVGQEAGFFCLQNDYWRILGLDTGYHSVGTPVLEFLPWFAPKCEFDEGQMTWLRDVVRLGDPTDKRGLVILTHHQFMSAFKSEEEYAKPAEQLASLFSAPKSVLWLWGHEHKLAFYEPIQAGLLTLYGRCIGHGGTPVDLDSKGFTKNEAHKGFSALVAVDTRERTKIQDKRKPRNVTRLGHNGYVVLQIREETLQLDYHDETALLLTETWTANRDLGTMQGQVQDHQQPGFGHEEGRSWPQIVA